jgi:hypothetical protein
LPPHGLASWARLLNVDLILATKIRCGKRASVDVTFVDADIVRSHPRRPHPRVPWNREQGQPSLAAARSVALRNNRLVRASRQSRLGFGVDDAISHRHRARRLRRRRRP